MDKQFCTLMVMFIFGIFFAPSCTDKKLQRGFQNPDYCFKNQSSRLTEKIRLDGYYTYNNKYNYSVNNTKLSKNNGQGSGQINIMFFSNGLALHEFIIENDVILYGKPSSYTLKGDTIKLLSSNRPPSAPVHSLRYDSFKIINDTTLDYLGFSNDKELDSERMIVFLNDSLIGENTLGVYSNAHFINSSITFDQNTLWLKKKKWFWCDKKYYESWRKSL